MGKCLCTKSISEAMFYDILIAFTLFYLYTLTLLVLNCLLVQFNVEFECTAKTHFRFMHLL